VDLIINMSGYELPVEKSGGAVEEWDVRDPIGESEEVFREVRDEIEQRVLRTDRNAALAQDRWRRRRSSRAQVDTRGGLLDNKSVPPILRMWRNWQTR
jgi:hypothetical protein